MAYDDSDLRGIGGWLAFLIVVLAVFTPLRIAFSVYGLYADPQVALAFGPRWPIVQAIEIGLAVLSVAGAWYAAWRLNGVHNWASVRIAIAAIWLLGLGAMALEVILVSLIGGIPVDALLAGGAADIVRAIVFATVWTLYLLRSRRVANTYGEDEAAIGDVFA